MCWVTLGKPESFWISVLSPTQKLLKPFLTLCFYLRSVLRTRKQLLSAALSPHTPPWWSGAGLPWDLGSEERATWPTKNQGEEGRQSSKWKPKPWVPRRNVHRWADVILPWLSAPSRHKYGVLGSPPPSYILPCTIVSDDEQVLWLWLWERLLPGGKVWASCPLGTAPVFLSFSAPQRGMKCCREAAVSRFPARPCPLVLIPSGEVLGQVLTCPIRFGTRGRWGRTIASIASKRCSTWMKGGCGSFQLAACWWNNLKKKKPKRSYLLGEIVDRNSTL